MNDESSAVAQPNAPQLERGLTLLPATALNVANMIGAGPFITIPAFLAAMGGPQALVAWVAAALLVLCDGLVWSELGAALPGSGGSYHFLRQTYAGRPGARLVPFLFIWQFLLSGPMEVASGFVAGVDYLLYLAPQLQGWLGAGQGGRGLLAAGAALAVTWLLGRRIHELGWLGVVLAAGSLATVLTIIVVGAFHFRPELFALPQNAFTFDARFAQGLGAAMTIAIYDYLGYYNVCHLGDEVRAPERTIPRAVVLSVVVVALLYLTMNTAILGVVPWQEAIQSQAIAATFMERVYGRFAAQLITGMILWTIAACMFAILLGYSRIPFAAARQGDFFRGFAYVHQERRYPIVSLWAVGGLTAACCFLQLETLVSATVTIRILAQFVAQIVGLHLFRRSQPANRLPFRMWFYPAPSCIALGGWLFLLGTAAVDYLLVVAAVLGTGVVAFAVWKMLGRGAES